jgi:RNA polymerase sigma-70 factor, ECF subfamily
MRAAIVSGLPPAQPFEFGDEKAFALFYRQYGACALLRIRSIVKDGGVAEELLQDAMLSAAKQSHTFDRTKGSAGNWLLAIAKNRALDHIRSPSNRMVRNSVPLLSCDQPASNWFLADLEKDERAQAVRAALQALPPNQRTVIELCFYEELSGSEISAKLGEPLGTIKTRMRSALKNLRNQLAQSESLKSRVA